MRFLTVEQLGPKQSRTPEGYLLIEDVPLARTGTMIYGPGETPITPGPDGITRIDRDPEEVFREETIASYNGKSFVDEHPAMDVGPTNWHELERGQVLNPRRGSGTANDVMFADILVKDPQTIHKIIGGKREVSCGYEADYVETAPGRGRQVNIIGNHVALVDSGRCGPRCAIGDSQTVKESGMKSLKDRILDAFKKKDESAMTAVLDELPENGATATHVHVHAGRTRDAEAEEEEDEEDKKKKTKDAIASLDGRVTKMEDAQSSMAKDIKSIKDSVDASREDEEEDDDRTDDNETIEFEAEAPPGTNDAAFKGLKDSKPFENSFQATMALGEIIAPGVKLLAFDAKSKPGKTVDALCNFRRRALDSVDGPAKAFRDELLGGHELSTRKCGDVRSLFNAVGTFVKNSNSNALRASATDSARTAAGVPIASKIKSIAELNKANTAHYNK